MLDPEKIRDEILLKIKKELTFKKNIPKDKMWILGWNDYIQYKKCRTKNNQYLAGWDSATQVTSTIFNSCKFLVNEFVNEIGELDNKNKFQRAFAHELN